MTDARKNRKQPLGICTKCYADWISEGCAGPIYCQPCEVLAVADDKLGVDGGFVILQGLSRRDYDNYITDYLQQKFKKVDSVAH